MEEPRPFSAEAERLFEAYRADGSPGSWQAWLLDHQDLLPGAPAGQGQLTAAEVRDRVARIRRIADDDEAAHGAEDALAAIADGTAEDPAELARLALETGNIEFDRWCA